MAESPAGGPPQAPTPAPQGGGPRVLSPGTFERHAAAVRYIEQVVRTRPPRESRQRSPGAAWGAYGLLPAGDAISGRAGLTLGEGDVTLYFRDIDDPAQLVTQDEDVHVYNPGEAIVADTSDLILPLAWIGGYWSVAASGDGGGGGPGRCDCPEDSYEVEVECGPCTSTYGGGPRQMPRYWWLTLGDATPHAYADPCPDSDCDRLIGQRIKLAWEGDAYGDDYDPAGCTWSGTSRGCITAELVVGEEWAVITILDEHSCILAVLRKPAAPFVCCGPNTGWESDPDAPCAIDALLKPHECTCCREPTCPPDDVFICEDHCGCPGGPCIVRATVSATCPARTCPEPPEIGPPPDCVPDPGCTGGPETVEMTWQGGCTYYGESDALPGWARLEWDADHTPPGWRLTARIDDCVTVVFRNATWDCHSDAPFTLDTSESLCDNGATPTGAARVEGVPTDPSEGG